MKDRVAWVIASEKNHTNKRLRELARDFEKVKKTVDFSTPEAERVMSHIEKALKMGYGFITYIDDIYPDELRHIAYPPPYLYTRGRTELLKHPLKVTFAGSRKASTYGLDVAATFAHAVAASRICVVSGGAMGIDTAALRGALRTSDDVIAVIGTGIDVDYPYENRELFDTIAKRGLIVSEFPLGTEPLPHNFPMRNRVMTALGDSVVIVEAAEKSGALISAEHAIEQGKTLFAVPGNINAPNSVGTNLLLRDGAMFAMSGEDIIAELMEREPDKYREAQLFHKKVKPAEKIIKAESNTDNKDNKKDNKNHLSPQEMAVINAIKEGKDTHGEIKDYCAMEINKLTSVLTILEIKGIIKLAFGNRYKLNE